MSEVLKAEEKSLSSVEIFSEIGEKEVTRAIVTDFSKQFEEHVVSVANNLSGLSPTEFSRPCSEG